MKIGGFMYSEQAYLCCQEAIRQEAGIQPPTLASHQWHIWRTDSEPWGRPTGRDGRYSFPQSVPLTTDNKVPAKCWDLIWLCLGGKQWMLASCDATNRQRGLPWLPAVAWEVEILNVIIRVMCVFILLGAIILYLSVLRSLRPTGVNENVFLLNICLNSCKKKFFMHLNI